MNDTPNDKHESSWFWVYITREDDGSNPPCVYEVRWYRQCGKEKN